MSVWHRPEASILTRTWPWPGSGIGRSSRTSGCLNAPTTAAFISGAPSRSHVNKAAWPPARDDGQGQRPPWAGTFGSSSWDDRHIAGLSETGRCCPECRSVLSANAVFLQVTVQMEPDLGVFRFGEFTREGRPDGRLPGGR